MEFSIVATTNEWDAPVSVIRRPDGTTHLTRDDEGSPERFAAEPGGGQATYFPHARIVFEDGTMSLFDLHRQPRG